jgi:uncharacterized SAM-binding protein YcdF (DUF218 family)
MMPCGGVRHNRAPSPPRLGATFLNSLFSLLDIGSWKPILTALLLPPVPFLVAILVGARLMLPRRSWGWSLIVLGVLGLWLGCCTGAGRLIEQFVLQPPPALKPDRIQQIKADAKNKAIVVLGGGVEAFAPEYGVSNLAVGSLERLRYGLWLSRETGVPVAFSGGMGWAQVQAMPEADVAARIAAQEFHRPLRWTGAESRDTRQNAARSVALLKRSGVTQILLVTHGWHMPRAMQAFEEAAGPAGMRIEAAPMGLAPRIESAALDWLPSTRGFQRVHNALRESLGRLAGA